MGFLKGGIVDRCFGVLLFNPLAFWATMLAVVNPGAFFAAADEHKLSTRM